MRVNGEETHLCKESSAESGKSSLDRVLGPVEELVGDERLVDKRGREGGGRDTSSEVMASRGTQQSRVNLQMGRTERDERETEREVLTVVVVANIERESRGGVFSKG
jgi:hypothetical protein